MADPGRNSRRYKEGDLVRWYKSKQMKLQDDIEESMEDAGEYGAETMKDIIRTSGTGRTWQRPNERGREGSYPGRVDTEKMINAVSSRVNVRGGSRQLRIGWVGGTREDYFQFQETGFHHVGANIDVEGMYALQDSTEAAFIFLQDDLKRRTREQ